MSSCWKCKGTGFLPRPRDDRQGAPVPCPLDSCAAGKAEVEAAASFVSSSLAPALNRDGSISTGGNFTTSLPLTVAATAPIQVPVVEAAILRPSDNKSMRMRMLTDIKLGACFHSGDLMRYASMEAVFEGQTELLKAHCMADTDKFVWCKWADDLDDSNEDTTTEFDARPLAVREVMLNCSVFADAEAFMNWSASAG